MRYRAIVATFMALCLSVLITACSSSEVSKSKEGMTYEDIRNTGLANSCPEIEATLRGTIPLDSGKSYRLSDLCIQPTTFFVKSAEAVAANKKRGSDFIPGKVMTRFTSSLDRIEGTVKVNADDSLTFVEEDGIDFSAITLQIPGGDQFPLLFTIKNLIATTQPGMASITSSTDFKGSFKVPSYRSSNFLDPKGRGLTTGYESAVAIPSSGDSDELKRENVKRYISGKGDISLQVSKIDATTGEISGSFESLQPSESDMGSREPSDIKIQGVFYARVAEAA
jgi:photosystem II oxygen-evolving enhancer protein 1